MQSLPPSQSTPVTSETASIGGYNTVGNFNTQEIPNILPAQAVNAPIQWWPNVFAWLWLAGVAVMVTYSAVSYYMLSLKIGRAVRVGTNIYKANNIRSPFVLGLINPKIYLPPNLNPQECKYILLHEQTHIGRKDHIIKLVAFLILTLHWFNPLVWVSFLLVGKDMEMSCDERVIKIMGGSIKKDYSRTLISMATGNRVIGASPIAFGEGGIKERVKNVLSFKKPSQIFLVFTVVLVLALSVGLAMNRASAQANESTPNYTQDSTGYESDTNTNGPMQSTPYVGAAHETGRIVASAPLPGVGWIVQGIQIGADHGNSGYGPYTLTIFYEPEDYQTANLMWDIPVDAFESIAEFLFNHIDNLQGVSLSANYGQTWQADENVFDYRWSITRSGAYNIEHGQGVWTWTEEDSISDFQEQHAGALTGPIAIVGNRLYLDPVEIIFISDHDRIEELWPNWVEQQTALFPEHNWSLSDLMPNGHYIRHFNVELIFWNDGTRIAELGLDPEAAFADGWPYEYRLPAETLSFEIAPDAVFEFIDSGLLLSDTSPYGNRSRATNLQDFLTVRPHLMDETLSGASTFRRIPMYIQVNELGQVVRVTEEFFLTQ